jgi:hypothetical protein
LLAYLVFGGVVFSFFPRLTRIFALHRIPLTAGPWAVDGSGNVTMSMLEDGDSFRLLFNGFRDTCLERHLYACQVHGWNAENLVTVNVSPPARLTAAGPCGLLAC